MPKHQFELFVTENELEDFDLPRVQILSISAPLERIRLPYGTCILRDRITGFFRKLSSMTQNEKIGIPKYEITSHYHIKICLQRQWQQTTQHEEKTTHMVVHRIRRQALLDQVAECAHHFYAPPTGHEEIYITCSLCSRRCYITCVKILLGNEQNMRI